MNNSYPSREKDRWEHALRRPLRGVSFEMLELMRMDLFEYLDVLTTCPYDDKESNKERAHDLLRIALRLAKLTPRRAKALYAAMEAGRVEYRLRSKNDPSPEPIASDAQEYWEEAQRTVNE
jgi:hypothetical protein